ncbi:MAG: MFS transporter [Lachnospiraceae bacterium]
MEVIKSLPDAEQPGKENGLLERNFLLIVIGQIISLFGNAILRFAIPLYILDQSNSASLFAFVSAVSFIPMIIMSPIGGLIADRVNKQRIMVVLDFITSALALGFILLNGRVAIVPLVVVMMMALYGIQGAYTPAVQASIPILVNADKIIPANAVINLVSSFAALIGPIIGGMLYAVYSITPIVVVSCICFLFSAVMEMFIYIPHEKKAAEGKVLAIVKGDMKESLIFVTKEKPILCKAVFMVFLFNMVFTSLVVIGVPVIITQTLAMDSNLYGISQGGMAVGGIIGGLLAGILGKKLDIRRSYLILCVCALCLVPMAVSLYAGAAPMVSYLVITVGCFLAMICATIFSVQMLAFVQMQTPVHMVGKIISCLIATSMCAQPVGQTVYGLLFEHIIAGQWLIVLGAALMSCVIALFSKTTFSRLAI